MKNEIYKHQGIFRFESGETISDLTITYSTYGTYSPGKNNVVWVCHALTANAEAHSWWPGLIGEGKLYDPAQYFIVCANILGSCYGSSGPVHINSATGNPYYLSFPVVTIRDMVAAHEVLRKHLGIERIHTCIGGSLGGQQAMEWAISRPSLIDHLILLATNAFHSPWGIAFNEAQRMSIKADPTWKDESPDAGRNGLMAARAIALLSYRNYNTYQCTQAETDMEKVDDYKASSYQNYQGLKLVNRFHCHSYWYLSKAMDSHHVGRGRGSVEAALQKIKSKTLLIGISSDVLFPVGEQIYLHQQIPGSQYEEIESLFGHDGFLIETEKIGKVITHFYSQDKEKIKV